ncbi:MAG: hypothetical protein V4676_04920 [Bacteroidota bacterium]
MKHTTTVLPVTKGNFSNKPSNSDNPLKHVFPSPAVVIAISDSYRPAFSINKRFSFDNNGGGYAGL